MKEFKVLMVDDEEDFVRTLDERMQMRNLDTSVALSGEEAMKKLEENPRCPLSRLENAGMDGMEVVRRAREAYPGVQVVMLTGHGSEADELEARRLGVFDYLRKPIALEQLMRTLKAAYKKKIDEAMVAASFAEEGDFDSAREIMQRGRERTNKRCEPWPLETFWLTMNKNLPNSFQKRLEARGFKTRVALDGDEAILESRKRLQTLCCSMS